LKLSDLESKGGKLKLVWILGLMAAFPALSTDFYLPAFPKVAADLGVNITDIQLTLSASFYGLAVGSLINGPISDRYGRKRPATVGIVIYVVASILCALAPNLTVLMIARFFQAFGGSASVVIGRAIARDLYSGQEMARILSSVSTIFLLVPIIGPSLGAAVLNVTTWHWIFGVLALFGAVALFAVARLPETLPKESRNQNDVLQALANYRQVIKDKEFRFATMQVATNSALIFGYLSSAPAVFMGLFGVSQSAFALMFASVAVVLVTVARINRKVLLKRSVSATIRGLVIVQFIGGALMMVALQFQPNMWVVLGLIMITVGCCNAIAGNCTTLALTNFRESAGSAGALVGVIQSTSAATVAAILAFIPVPPLPKMLGFMFIMALLALTIMLIRERSRRKELVIQG
jgi:DHA1 family bicyclomycin/chloramphenicol resistance-like MFS transporter